ncbi:MAG: class I tRNA ligase family protein [Thermoplasmata archaeon]
MDPAAATRWQEAWARAGIASGRRDAGRRKFYALVAYPGASGFLHVGHLRALAYADALHRFHRALGESVLFPFGLHASGLPAVTWAQRVREREPAVVALLEAAGVPPAVWAALEEPEGAARFLGDEYRRALRRIGALVDEGTYLTTEDDDYHRFVQWQLRRLHDVGLVVQGTYFASVCPVCGPVAVDPSETDLSSGGAAEIVRYATVPFHLEDGRILLAATLRPETVYGVSNLWLAPQEELVVWHHGPQEFLVARSGAERLVEQHGGHVGHAVRAGDLLGKTVRVPLVGASVPIVGSGLVDPEIGTGVVMSVPAHSPADAAALADLGEAGRTSIGPPRVLIEIGRESALSATEEALIDGAGTPAERALRATGAKGLADRSSVESATERLYRLEFARGRMTVDGLEGVPVRDARERVVKELAPTGESFELQEFSIPVVCRNGHRVTIRRVSDQWFLRYSDAKWKARTLDLAHGLSTWPAQYGRELPGILEWFGDRPCARKGRWLGTRLPFDPTWIIEPIADSTFYMAYYVVRRFVSSGRLGVEHLTDAFFDYVFLGRGGGEPTVEPGLLREVREEFLYWYPLDINMGGHEHKSVHFPVFLYAHAILLPPELQPRGIYVNGWITGPSGTKLSKKEVSLTGGRFPPIDRALERWGPDPLRLYYASAAEPTADVEWSSEAVDAARQRLDDIERLVRERRGEGRGPPELDAWLLSRMHRLVTAVRTGFAAAEIRPVAEAVYVQLPALLRRYYARGGSADATTDRVGAAWIALMAPITPHLAEELGEGRKAELVATWPFPSPEEFPLSEEAEAREEYLAGVEDDLRAVLRPAREHAEAAPDEVVFFLAAPWKATVEGWMREAVSRGETPSVRAIMERVSVHAELAAERAEVPRYVQRVGPLLRSEAPPVGPTVDEAATLRAAEGYLTRRFGFGAVRVVPESEGEPLDPMRRRDRSRPGKPAFYLIRPGGGAFRVPPAG